MATFHRTGAQRQPRGVNGLYLQSLNCDKRTHDVHNRVECPNLMKMDLFRILTMDFALCLCQAAKGLDAFLFDLIAQTTHLDQFSDFPKGSFMCWRALRLYCNMGPSNEALFLDRHLNLKRFKPQPRKTLDQYILGNSKIEKPTQDHVAANTREAIEISDPHGKSPSFPWSVEIHFSGKNH